MNEEKDISITETERLCIEKLTIEDSGFIFKLMNSPNWIRGIGQHNVKSIQSARKYIIEGPLSSYHQNGFGLYKLILKENEEFVGICGLVKRPELTLPDLGYAILPEFEGKGIAFEAAQEVINLARKKFEIHKLLAITSKNNVESIYLLEKLGFVYQKNTSEEIEDNMRLYAQPLQIL